MPDEIRTCRQCGQGFRWTEKEQRELALDQVVDGEYDPSRECKSCRIKQDGQR